MKIFITGSSGTGKSTVIKALQDRGFTAYDTDDVPESTRLELRETGEPVDWPKGYVDWSKYSWQWQSHKLRELLASDEDVYIGAVVGNWRDFISDFDHIIVLTVPEDKLLNRLRNRKAHTFGQDEQNLIDTVKNVKKKEEKFVEAGATRINNDRPVEVVVKGILDLVSSK